MTKIGRNEPCHCGSGKKYKKCCMMKDKAAESEHAAQQFVEPFSNVSILDDEREGDMDDEFPDFFAEEFEDDKLNGEYDTNEIPESIKNDPRLHKQIDDEHPEISDEENKLVDIWWEEYKGMDDPLLERAHLEKFMESYPKLVVNLGLHYEVLFELGSEYLKMGRVDDHIQFLMRIRREFPDTYLKSAGYYDADIIAWLIANDRSEEIAVYFDNFINHPIDFVDQLFELVDLLQAVDLSTDLQDLIKMVYEPVFYSQEVFGGQSIVTPLVTGIYSKYLSPDFTDEDLDKIIIELRELNFEYHEDVYTIGYWRSEFEKIFRPYELWEPSKPVTNRKIRDLYIGMSKNFMFFLTKRTRISWISADYYSMLISEYLHSWHSDTKKRKQALFDFSKDTVDKQAVNICKKMGFFIDSTKMISLLNAIYYFAEYLDACGNIDKSQVQVIQKDVTDLYNEFYPNLKKQYIESYVFANFPMWG